VSLALVPVSPLSPERYKSVLNPKQSAELDRTVERAGRLLGGRVVWSVNSTAAGGGVAEMLRSLISYARGAGIDARWAVISGDAAFFEVTKRLHNNLHGAPGDGGDLGDAERAVYEAVCRRNADDLCEIVRKGDIVLLHDPQTAGLCGSLLAADVRVVWRCHVGLDVPNDTSRRAWDFLRPYVEPAEALVFSREAYRWEGLDDTPVVVIPPSIDAFSPKNQMLEPAAVGAIVSAVGLGMRDSAVPPIFTRQDGSPGRVDRRAVEHDHARPLAGTRLVTQVSRWDRLKDPFGVMQAFVEHIAPRTDAQLLLAGPDVSAVADDPEGADVLAEVTQHRSDLPSPMRERVHLAELPMEDPEENGAIVNAIQRRSDVIVQKSLVEGFGLTVLEGMWKGTPVVASRVGGLQDQIVDGESGLLVEPHDLEAFGAAVVRLLTEPTFATEIARNAQQRVLASFLGPRHLTQYVDLFARLLAA
jgi:trehalose synthase